MRIGRWPMNRALWIFCCVASAAAPAVGVVARALAGEEAVDVSKLPPAATRAIDYVEDIQPILAQSCYRCHRPKTQEAGLRLDAKKQALAGADSGPVIV